MSAAQYDDLNNTLGDTKLFLEYLAKPDALPNTEQGRFIARRAEQLLEQVAQSLKDIHQPVVRHAIIDTPEEGPQSVGAA